MRPAGEESPQGPGSILRADLALIGYGNVARRFVRLLDESRARLARDYGLVCRIVGLATRRHGAHYDPGGVDLEHADALGVTGHDDRQASFDVIERLGTSDAELRVVVETTTLDIRDGQPAIDHVRAAFAAGCHVVTVNKGPAAFAYASLRAAAETAGVSFLFEGAVMDGVPVFNLVRDTLPAIDILGFRGVVNSTTNHILCALESGHAFSTALADMEAQGITEADPSLDVDGWDAAAKTAALANVLMDARMTPHDVARTGIGSESSTAARQAVEHGCRLRLVASATRMADGRLECAVAPTELPADDLLARLRGPANALILHTDLLGDIAVCQIDGSLTHTAYALLSDLLTIWNRQPAHRAAPARQTRQRRGR